MSDSDSNDSPTAQKIAIGAHWQNSPELCKANSWAQADIDLPRITAIGNQSAGKSSLVEAIADASNFKKTVSHGVLFSPILALQSSTQKGKGRVRCSDLGRIGRDIQSSHHRQEDFEPMLRRAQLAILNPSVLSSTFVHFDLSLVAPGRAPEGSTKQQQFSANVVCLDLSGPNVPDLSFINLPGIISNVVEGEDHNNIEL
ncbi:hypothetical protein C8J57DRAFT_1464612 [Mycena rebaudengoi]|nr:hypothetical protein C8J57DRAFT_1464612 [Mycena rebaudengoi]